MDFAASPDRAHEQDKGPVIRYPGGCFADSYDWRDGVGPADKRPRRTNFWANSDPVARQPQVRSQRIRHQRICTFLQTDRCEPYLAANVRSLPAQEFYRWVEYCNSPAGSTTLAENAQARRFATNH